MGAFESSLPVPQTASQLHDSVPPRKPPIVTAMASGEEEPDDESTEYQISGYYTRRLSPQMYSFNQLHEETRLEMAKRLTGELATVTIEFFTGIDV